MVAIAHPECYHLSKRRKIESLVRTNMTRTKAISSHKMNRREFLALSALGAVPCILSACQNGMSGPVNVAPTPFSTGQLSSTQQPSPTQLPPTNADWSALAASLQGTLIRPNSSGYPVALQLFDPRFDSIKPAAIAYCASPADVQHCLNFVSHF